MAVNTRFSIAVHLLAGLGLAVGRPVTSAELAGSVNTAPSFVRRVLARLSKAGLIRTSRGKAGACWLARNPGRISLLDIYRAVDAPKAFAIHQYPPEPSCRVSRNIKSCLSRALAKTQRAFENSLDEMTLAHVLADLKKAR